MRKGRLQRLTLASLALLSSGCTFFLAMRAATVPMPMVHHAAPGEHANGVVIMLPGMADAPDDYEQHGMVAMVQEANPRLDVICVDAHFGYYSRKVITERLHEDVIAPLAARYEHIWLVGISLGGLGSVAYACDYPKHIDGVVLMAPFMGDGDVLDDVRAAGGPRHYVRPPDEPSTSDSQRRFRDLWQWYGRVVNAREDAPKLFLGYGEQDRFAATNAMVGEQLPPGRWLTGPGGHKWTVWKQLFAELSVRAFADLR